MGVIFVSGCYGVGKTFLTNHISEKLGLPTYSASDLISKYNNEKYGANKYVHDINHNQQILVSAIENIIKEHQRFILNGHSCIINKDNTVSAIPMCTFKELNLEQIILLKAPVEFISNNLKQRDNVYYTKEMINEIQSMEEQILTRVASDFHIPLFIHERASDIPDINTLISMIGG